MVFDHLSHADLYTHLGPRFAAALAYLKNFSPEIPDGKQPVDGDNLYAAVQTYETAPASEKKWEAHRRYADVQFIVSGEEIIYHRDISTLTPRTEYIVEKDYVLYENRDDQSLVCGPGSFAIFFPHDGHKPGCALNEPTTVRKVVMKVLLD